MKIIESTLRKIIKQELMEALTDAEIAAHNAKVPRTHWELRKKKEQEQEEKRQKLANEPYTSFVLSQENLTDTQKHNFLTLFRDYSYRDDEVLNMVEEIPPLRDKKIKGKIAKGTQGEIFSLEGGSLFKIYRGSYLTTIEGENERYSKLKDASFSGAGSQTDLLVYDNGLFDYSGRIVGWVEMGRVLVLKDYLLIINNFDEDKTYKDLEAYGELYNLMQNDGPKLKNRSPTNAQQAYNDPFIQQNVVSDPKYTLAEEALGQELTKNLVMGMLKMYYDNNKNRFVFQDMHAGNVGVVGLQNPTPVFFDI